AKSVLVTDRLRIAPLPDLGVEPPACVQPLRLTGERQSPFAEARFEIPVFEYREIADAPDADRVQVLLHYLTHAGNLPNLQRGQVPRFKAGLDPENAVPLRLI